MNSSKISIKCINEYYLFSLSENRLRVKLRVTELKYVSSLIQLNMCAQLISVLSTISQCRQFYQVYLLINFRYKSIRIKVYMKGNFDYNFTLLKVHSKVKRSSFTVP